MRSQRANSFIPILFLLLCTLLPTLALPVQRQAGLHTSIRDARPQHDEILPRSHVGLPHPNRLEAGTTPVIEPVIPASRITSRLFARALAADGSLAHVPSYDRSNDSIHRRSFIDNIKKGFQNFGNKIKQGFQKVGNAFKNAGQKIKQGFQKVGQAFKHAGNKIKQGFQKAGQALKHVGNKIKQGFQKVGHALKHVGQKIKQGIQHAGHKIKQAFHKVGKAFKHVGNKIKQGFQHVGNKIKHAFHKVKQAFHHAGQKIKQGFQHAGKKIKEGFQKVGHALKHAGHKIKEGFVKAGHWIKENGAKVAKFGLKVISTVASVASKVAKFIPGIGKPISTALDIGSKLTNLASKHIHADLPDNLKKHMDNMDKVQNPIGGVAGKILEVLKRDETPTGELVERDLAESNLFARGMHEFDERAWEDDFELEGRSWDDNLELDSRSFETELELRFFDNTEPKRLIFSKDP